MTTHAGTAVNLCFVKVNAVSHVDGQIREVFMSLQPAYSKNEWNNILKVPESARSEHVKKVLEKCGDVISAWVDGSEIECRRADGSNHWTVIHYNEKLSFFDKLEFRVTPTVEVSFCLTWRQANEFLKVLENTTFNSIPSREARTVVMNSMDKDIQNKWGN